MHSISFSFSLMNDAVHRRTRKKTALRYNQYSSLTCCINVFLVVVIYRLYVCLPIFAMQVSTSRSSDQRAPTLSWSHVYVTAPKQNRRASLDTPIDLLHDVSGYARSGEILAVMGTSGVGEFTNTVVQDQRISLSQIHLSIVDLESYSIETHLLLVVKLFQQKNSRGTSVVISETE